MMVQVFGTFTTLCFFQPVVGLIVNDFIQILVNVLRCRLHLECVCSSRVYRTLRKEKNKNSKIYLSHDRYLFSDAGQRVFFPHLQVHVHQLVRERGELVAKTYGVWTTHGSYESVAVELRFHLSVNHFFGRRLDYHVDVVLTAGDYLQTTRCRRDAVTQNVDALTCPYKVSAAGRIPDTPAWWTYFSRYSRSNSLWRCPGVRTSVRSRPPNGRTVTIEKTRLARFRWTVSFRSALRLCERTSVCMRVSRSKQSRRSKRRRHLNAFATGNATKKYVKRRSLLGKRLPVSSK